MKRLLLILFLLLGYSHLVAFEKVSFGFGKDIDNSDVYKIAIIKDLKYQFIKKTNMNLEVSADFLEGKIDKMFILSAQPLLTYNLTNRFYIELGIGLAYFSKTKIDSRKYGLKLQFKESIGLGYNISDRLVTKLNLSHYSNGNLRRDNEGLDVTMLNLIYRF